MRYLLAITALALLGACERPAERAAEPAAEPARPSEPPVVRAAGDSSLAWANCPAPFPAGCEMTVLHGDPAKPSADVLLRVPAGSVLPAHSHSSAERMMLVSGRLDVRYKGAAAARLLPGTYAYGPAGLPHTATCMASEPCQLFVAFEGPVDVVPYEGEL
jgi:quercetin dioxygenase-like cupin family protein